MARSRAWLVSDCDGKRAGDACPIDGGIGTCVPDCDAQCFTCVAAKPSTPDSPVVASGGCGGGLALVLVLFLVAFLR